MTARPGRRLRPRRGVVDAALASLLLAVVAAVTLVTGMQAARHSVAVHRKDRVDLQRTLAELTSNYLTITAGDVNRAAVDGGWALTRDNPSDIALLQRFLDSSPLVSYAAEVVDPQGGVLSGAGTWYWLPDSTDPGYAPLRAGLSGGRPGVSDVMTAGDGTPVVALAVPIRRAGHPVALLEAFVDARTWGLQRYLAGMQLGPQARPYIVDRHGIVAAGPDRTAVGRPVPVPGPQGATGLTTYQRAGTGWTAITAPVGLAGWSDITTQPTALFEGSTLSRNRTAEAALLVGLLVLTTLVIGAVLSRGRAVRRLADLALSDPLTGLASRRQLDLHLSASVARQRRSGATLAVLYGDLDGFKSANDHGGHHRGDSVLVEVAQRLRAAARGDDVVARVGGDEFVVVAECVEGSDEAVRLAQRLRAALATPVTVGAEQVTVGISVGVAVGPACGAAPAALLECADQAMYEAKRQRAGIVVRHVDAVAAVPEQRYNPERSSSSDTSASPSR